MPQPIDRLPHDDAFLSTAQALLPWDRLAALLAQHDPSGALTGMARGLRLHTVQQRYGLDDATLLRKNQRPLIATLKAAAASFDDGRVQPGVNQLNAFQNKVRAQVAPLDQALADSLINAAQVIIDTLNGP